MSLTLAEVRRGLIAASVEPPQAPSALRRLAAAFLPLVLILLWAAAVRLPFYAQTDKDEFFFSIAATRWLQGELPYVAFYDLKPPGLFFLYAVAQWLFGVSLATIKGMEIVATGFGAWLLYWIAIRHGTQRIALWSAILYPVFTLALGGPYVVNLILQLPFLILAFAAALAATQRGASAGKAYRDTFWAGLVIGFAGMLKQTAIFEAAALFLILCVWGVPRRLWLMLPLFVIGAAIPAAACVAYFAAMGHFAEMFDAVVVLALSRTASDVLDVYGPDLAYNFTVTGIAVNVIACSVPFTFLWGGAVLTATRFQRIRAAVPVRLLAVAGIWLAAALASAISGKGLTAYYLLVTVPPLLILSGAFIGHGMEVSAAAWPRVFAVACLAAIVSLAVIERKDLFTPSPLFASDPAATREVADRILALRPAPDDRLLVLNRGFAIYMDTGLMPPAPVFHPGHILGTFPTPYPDPLRVALDALPRFIVFADPQMRHITETEASHVLIEERLVRDYRVAGVVEAPGDSFTIYERAR